MKKNIIFNSTIWETNCSLNSDIFEGANKEKITKRRGKLLFPKEVKGFIEEKRSLVWRSFLFINLFIIFPPMFLKYPSLTHSLTFEFAFTKQDPFSRFFSFSSTVRSFSAFPREIVQILRKMANHGTKFLKHNCQKRVN